MTTLDRNRFLAGKLREFYESHPISTELLEAANALDALSSIPEQGVGGWQHRVFFYDTKTWSEWRDGKHNRDLANPFEERPLYIAPSQPAAVGVTDEMVERVSVPYDGFTGDVIGNYTTREGKQGVVVQQDGTRVVHVYGRSRVEAALRSTP